MHPSDMQLVAGDRAGFLGGRLAQKEYRFIHKNGSLRWGRVSNHPVLFKDKIIGYQGVITDITQAKSFNINLLKVVQDNILTNLASSFNVEIGIPLKRARARLLPGKSGEEAGGINDSIRELMHDLEGISLYLKNMNAFMENINEEAATADINALLENALILLKRQFAKNGIDICTELSRRLEPVTVDSFAMVQVFLNIFHYALAEHANKTKNGRLLVTTTMEEDKVVVDIRESDADVSQELVSRLSDPFYLHRRRKGSGVGLAVARQLVENQAGEFSVISGKRERGLQIRISLPAVIQML
jgi:C4-dicarboxylate-specific signal transduction histidine kinase